MTDCRSAVTCPITERCNLAGSHCWLRWNVALGYGTEQDRTLVTSGMSSTQVVHFRISSRLLKPPHVECNTVSCSGAIVMICGVVVWYVCPVQYVHVLSALFLICICLFSQRPIIKQPHNTVVKMSHYSPAGCKWNKTNLKPKRAISLPQEVVWEKMSLLWFDPTTKQVLTLFPILPLLVNPVTQIHYKVRYSAVSVNFHIL